MHGLSASGATRRERSQRRRRRLLTSRWSALHTKPTLLFTAGGDNGFSAAATFPRPHGRHHHRAKPAPQQRFGSAAGKGHLAGSAGNHTVPATLRSKYPLREPDGTPQVRQNTASVVDAPEQPARGFDAASSPEQPDRRDAFGTTYTNADGTETSVVSTTPVNYRGSDGRWVPVDPKLTRAGDGWRNGADAVGVRFAGSADATELARVDFDADHAFGFGLAGAAGSAGQAADSSVVYPSVLDQTDVRLDAVSGGVKETLV